MPDAPPEGNWANAVARLHPKCPKCGCDDERMLKWAGRVLECDQCGFASVPMPR